MRSKLMFCSRAFVGLIFLLLYLTACGGAGGKPDQTGSTPPVKYANYEAQSDALRSTWDAISFTDPSTLPLSGSAVYSGVIRLDVERGPGEISMDGALKMQVSFADATVTGNATKFVDENNAAYKGSLALSNGIIDRGADPNVDYTLRADLNGTLSGAGENFDISADLSGDFHGSAWGAASGGVQGSAVSSYGTGYVFGDFVAAR